MIVREVDLAILGGGCAGLSLARQLACAESRGADIPETIVLEPRTSYENDRTWCSWVHARDGADPLAARRWSSWSFSSAGERHVHRSSTWSYQCIPAQAFYEEALQAIEGSRRISLMTGVRVEDVRERLDGLLVEAGERQWRARRLVDTRPPGRARLDGSTLMQTFAGVEIRCERALHERDVVGLMERMAVDELGFRFDYVLPLAADHLLVEATRFGAVPVSDERLERELRQSVRRLTRPAGYVVVRREGGAIPMGLPEPSAPADPRWVRAGTGGGAVRAATGYAYQRIQRWARRCTVSILRGGHLVGQAPTPPFLGWMDRLFLGVLRDEPRIAPDLFMALARRLGPEAFARFMTDAGSWRDHLAVIRALPPGPFLRQLRHRSMRPPARLAVPSIGADDR